MRRFTWLVQVRTGWAMAVLDTLPGSYDKTKRCMKKVRVEIFSVYLDISFGNIKTEKITEISFNNRYNRNNRFNMNKLNTTKVQNGFIFY